MKQIESRTTDVVIPMPTIPSQRSLPQDRLSRLRSWLAVGLLGACSLFAQADEVSLPSSEALVPEEADLLGRKGDAMLAKEACGNLEECLLCSGLADPNNYAEGAMKAMKEIAPGYHKWLFRSDVDLSNEFGIPNEMQPEFARLMREFSARNVKVVIAVQPTRGLMHRKEIRPEAAHGFDYPTAYANLSAFLDQLRAGGAIVPNILPLVEHPPKSDYFFRRDHHWTPVGSEATARIVADEIKRHDFYQDLTKKAYKTEVGVMIPKDGTMNRALKKICGNNWGFQYTRGYQTVPAEDSADALFDDAADPEVILVGTSNSAARDDEAKNYNFDGYLKEYLSLDILNEALPGAGQDGALLQYLQAGDYNPDEPPKMIVWELPASFRLEDPLMYRQMIPAIKGGCAKSKHVVANNHLDLPMLALNDRIEILSNSGDKRQSLNNFKGFLDIKIGDKNVKDFYVITYYDNGERDKVWFRREAIVDGGQYYLELSPAKQYQGANLLSVFIEPTEELKTATTLDVQLCE